jgi:multidrug resistance efflux pump
MRWTLLLPSTGLLGGAALALAFWWPFGEERELRLPGVVEIQEVRVASKVGGRVAEIKIKEGNRVEPGQELVLFEVPELRAQRDQQLALLAEALADLEKAQNGPRMEEKETAQQAMKAAQARWEKIKKGPREEEIRQARSEWESAEADLRWAREEFTRAERTYRQFAGARADFDMAKAVLERNRGRENAARARLDLLVAGSRQEDKDEALAEFKRTEANYELLRNGTRSEDLKLAEARVALARGKLAELEAHLAEAVVRAPEPAVVDVLAVRKGDVVPPNGPVVRLLRASDLWVKVYVPETQLGRLRLNQDVEVTGDAFPGRRFPGRIDHIASESEFTPRNVQSADERRHQLFGAKILLQDPEGVFKAGMAAEVIIPLKN